MRVPNWYRAVTLGPYAAVCVPSCPLRVSLPAGNGQPGRRRQRVCREDGAPAARRVMCGRHSSAPACSAGVGVASLRLIVKTAGPARKWRIAGEAGAVCPAGERQVECDARKGRSR